MGSTMKRYVVILFVALSVVAFVAYTHLTSSLIQISQKKELNSYLNSAIPFTSLKQRIDEDKLHEIKEPKLTANYSDVVPYLFGKNFTPSYTLGSGSAYKVSIAIGIPSIKRSGVSYLFDTLHSVFHDIYPFNEDHVLVVVMLAETDQEFVKSTGRKIYETYTRQVNNGLLQVIAPDESVYPDFNKLQQTLGDSVERLKWRSKEVYDAAYLMLHCVGKADYYLMMEDDVIASKGYVGAALNFISQHMNEEFIFLSLGNFFSIGKVFKMRDVPTWATFFLTFLQTKPIDWLMNDYIQIVSCYTGMPSENCEKTKRKKLPQLHPGIFQHIGKKSSLVGKVQNIVDNEFSGKAASSNPHKNPAAKVETSFEAAETNNAQAWYDDSGGMQTPYRVKPATANQNIKIVFEYPQNITKILVKTGEKAGKAKLPFNSTLLEYHDENSIGYKQCAVFDHNGEAECRFNNQPMKNIRIRTLSNLSRNTWFDLIFVK